MENIKIKLKDVIQTVMIPESQEFIKELKEVLKKEEQIENDINALVDMKSFIIELQDIISAIDKNLLSDAEAEEIYNKINHMLEEHEDEH
ncbi:hypothetical protein [Aliarcobacter cibarius]|uniref:DNA repair protein Rad50 n=1 Tax=Aliarcobacter cibarius TaxID=255507 RepID=A0A7L5JM21_9BACT|nr:hypothetical protein [Aliarcobacter cibarius]QKJ26273.1 hypothetical protein ACBT_0297 [Aliarcobacter cibarius]TLT02722.1 DNA repair protein Rad50 [Aliarcobacter cibarius]